MNNYFFLHTPHFTKIPGRVPLSEFSTLDSAIEEKTYYIVRTGGGTLKVLVCDDDAKNRSLLKEALNLLKCQAIEAANGADGIALTKQEKPDIILMDHTMPDMMGYEAIKEIRKEPGFENIPFVMITGDFEVQALVEQDKLEHCAFLPKPYGIDQLTATMELALGKPLSP